MQNGNLIIKVPLGTSLCVIGDIHEHIEQYEAILNKWQPSNTKWIVQLGDVYDKGFGQDIGDKITKSLMDLNSLGICYVVRGNHELKLIKKNKKNLTKELQWWRNQPLSITFDFARGNKLTVLHAGVLPNWDSVDLSSNIEQCYVRDVDLITKQMIPLIWIEENGEKKLVKKSEGGKPWHELYDGRFGYIIAGHNAQKDGQPKFFNFSANIDVGIYDTGKLCGQVIDENGKLGETIIVSGTAAKPEI